MFIIVTLSTKIVRSLFFKLICLCIIFLNLYIVCRIESYAFNQPLNLLKDTAFDSKKQLRNKLVCRLHSKIHVD